MLLLMDNHSSHGDLVDPRGQVRIEGLPPNVTSRVQPMDAGIIKTFKTGYRYQLLQSTVAVALGKPLPDDFLKSSLAAGKQADVRDAMHLAQHSWDRVDANTIVRCWLKTGLLPEQEECSLARSHGRVNVDSMLMLMNQLALSIPDDVSSVELANIRSASQASAGAMEHWVSLEDDPRVQEAQVFDVLVNPGYDGDV